MYNNYNKNIIYSYRIKRAISINMLMNIDLEDEIAIYKNMIHAVNIHCKAMQLVYLFCHIYLIYIIILSYIFDKVFHKFNIQFWGIIFLLNNIYSVFLEPQSLSSEYQNVLLITFRVLMYIFMYGCKFLKYIHKMKEIKRKDLQKVPLKYDQKIMEMVE